MGEYMHEIIFLSYIFRKCGLFQSKSGPESNGKGEWRILVDLFRNADVKVELHPSEEENKMEKTHPENTSVKY